MACWGGHDIFFPSSPYRVNNFIVAAFCVLEPCEVNNGHHGNSIVLHFAISSRIEFVANLEII